MTTDKHYLWHMAGALEWQEYAYFAYIGHGEGFLYGICNGYTFGYTDARIARYEY